MKRFLVGLFLNAALVVAAHAGCNVGALPFVFQNNTVADATQVNADFNQIVNGLLTNCAASGANSDITSLSGITTPIGPVAGGSTLFLGGTSGGSANAQTVTTTAPSAGFSLTTGFKVSFTAGFTNAPGALTLNVNATGAKPVARLQWLGISAALVGNEFVVGQRILAEYDGTNYQILSRGVVTIGEIFDYGGAACPQGTLSANSQAVSRTTYADLFSLYGSTFGAGDGVTTFNLPDLRARVAAGQDQNVGGLSNRITVAGGNFDGTVLGGSGGLQNHTMTTGEIATHNHTITDPGHVHVERGIGGGAGIPNLVQLNSLNGDAASASSTSSATTGITVNNTGISTPFTILSPALIVLKCVRA